MEREKSYKIGYKVVRRLGKTWRSHTFKPVSNMALQRIRYKVGQWTIQRKNEFGAFTVFSDLDSAKAFLNAGFGDTIYKCFYVPSKEKYLWRREQLKKRFELGSRGLQFCYYFLENCPSGTVFARAVKLLEQVA